MKKVLLLTMLAATVATQQQMNAQTTVIDGEIRPRFEVQDGFKSPLLKTSDPGVFGIQRTRLNASFTSGIFNSQITLQDSRTYGQTANASSDATLGLFEAWAETWLLPGASLKVGRQTIKYDDGRLFSASAWSNTGTSHDAAMFRYSINDFQGNLGIAYNNKSAISKETYYVPGASYRYMSWLWLSKDIINGLNVSLIGVDEGVQDTTGTKSGANYVKTNMYHAYTYGGNIKYQNEGCPLSVLGTAYFQSGKNATGKKLNGKMLAARVDYKINSTTGFNFGTDYVSGDKNSDTDGKASNFKKLYGGDHTLYGLMDYWDAALTQGLLDYYAGVSKKFGNDLSIEAAFHYFNSEYSGANKKKIEFGRDLGSEFDLVVNYKLNSWTSVQGGWCKYFSNNNTLIAKDLVSKEGVYPDIHSPQWGYIMLTIKPTFLNTATAK